jgi:hypothetical protein
MYEHSQERSSNESHAAAHRDSKKEKSISIPAQQLYKQAQHIQQKNPLSVFQQTSDISGDQKTESPLQLFPVNRRNTRSNRTFRITNSGSRLEAIQTAGDMDDMHYGYATYTIREDSLELGHIESDPEEGSGIGSLLMMFLAEIAIAQGKESITIPTAAFTAVGFYELAGAKSADEERSNTLEARLSDDGDQIETALELYFSTRAKIDYDTDPDHHKMIARSMWSRTKTQLQWVNLGQSEKEALIQEQREIYGLKSNPDKLKTITSMIHGKAVGNMGMVGNSSTMLERSQAMCTRWVDPAAWTPEERQAVWDSRNDTTTLTEFPRRGGD